MTRDFYENEIIKYGKMTGEKNFSPGYSGNISMRFNDKVLITVSGSANQYLTKDDLVLMDYEGVPVEEGKKPSSEKLVHTAIYKLRKDINAIIHVHSPYLSAFASSHISLNEPIMAESIFYFGKIAFAEYGLPSSIDLAEKTVKHFEDNDAVLMANHGFIIGSKTIKDAYLKLEIAESYAQVVLNTKMLGGAVLLTDEQVNQINSLKS